LTELNTFLIITLFLWCDWYAPTVTIWSDYQLFKLWHHALRRHLWLPPRLFFPIIIVVQYVLMEIAFYSYFQLAFGSPDPYWVVEAVGILFVVNLLCTKQWIAVYMVGGRQKMALALLAGMFATFVPIIVLFANYGHWLSFGTYVSFFVFWLGALYLNVRTCQLERRGVCDLAIDKVQLNGLVARYKTAENPLGDIESLQ
jgi:tryptophan-rich sensory protein